MLRATAVSAICLALAGEVSAFAPSVSLPLSSSRATAATRAASVVCAAEGAAGRREVLQRAAVLSGAVFLKGPAAFAADDDDGERARAPRRIM